MTQRAQHPTIPGKIPLGQPQWVYRLRFPQCWFWHADTLFSDIFDVMRYLSLEFVEFFGIFLLCSGMYFLCRVSGCTLTFVAFYSILMCYSVMPLRSHGQAILRRPSRFSAGLFAAIWWRMTSVFNFLPSVSSRMHSVVIISNIPFLSQVYFWRSIDACGSACLLGLVILYIFLYCRLTLSRLELSRFKWLIFIVFSIIFNFGQLDYTIYQILGLNSNMKPCSPRLT